MHEDQLLPQDAIVDPEKSLADRLSIAAKRESLDIFSLRQVQSQIHHPLRKFESESSLFSLSSDPKKERASIKSNPSSLFISDSSLNDEDPYAA